ncbi:hypothetical protein DNU06_05040 [Putridiphycobacter roseus]|uniref:DUF5056 domain-containing protein n=1 Tax=Putridiphycobacter roseus TaxID=2219161 RepID=A0A2W1N147_9FLAO|nr:hypothetical protein [Putridiphycobacter roseus]PZE17987.1 hypothetical protein DNU06_05040 [Putridiphycobacter roseus]
MDVEKDPIKNTVQEDFFSIEVPKDFSERVMRNIEVLAAQKKVVKPLIAKKAWYWVIGIAALVFVIGFWVDIQTAAATPIGFSLPELSFTDFKLSIRLFAIISCMLTLLTLADVFYRRFRRNA